MDDHITKPIDPAKLYTAVVKWIPPVTNPPHQTPVSGPEPQPSTDLPQLPSELPGLDLHKGLQRVDGHEKLYRQLLVDFQRHHSNDSQKIRQALKENDLKGAHLLSHTLKGIGGTLGAFGLQKAATALDISIAADLQEEIPAQLGVVAEELAQVIQAINTLPEKKQAPAKSPIDPGDYGAYLSYLELLLANSDTEALHLMEEINAGMQGSPLQKPMAEIDTLVRSYDFEGALKPLQVLLLTLEQDD